MSSVKAKLNQTLASITVTLGVFALGTVLGWSSPSLPNMLQELSGYFINVTKEDQSWIGSIATLGALASCPLGGFSIDKLGRKRTMVIVSIPFTIGWILIGYSSNVIMMCVGRFISGFCGGIFSLSSPVYIGEVSDSKIRGMLMNAFQLQMVTGILFTYVLGAFVSWKTLALICGAVPLIFLLLSFCIPESPRYLIAKGRIEEARTALNWFRVGNLKSEIDDELTMMESSVKGNDEKSASVKDLLQPNVLKPLILSLSLMILEQASAFNVVIFYCVDIFAATGSNIDSYWASIIVAVVQVIATFLGTFLVDNAGRRILLILSEAFMALSFIALGAFFYAKHVNNDVVPKGLGWLPLVSVIVFIVAFAIGIGPLSWTIMGELIHPNFKGICSAIAVSLVWLSAFVVTKIYQSLVDAVGIHFAFWIFSTVSIIGTFLVYFTIPETKGKTLDEIQEFFNKSHEKPNAKKVSGSSLNEDGLIIK